MGRPKNSRNKNPYPAHRHRNFYWQIISKKFVKELAAFKRMHDRVRDKKVSSIQWPRTLEGFRRFLVAAGTAPVQLRKLSIGRIKHSIGYKTGNIRWEEHAINSVK